LLSNVKWTGFWCRQSFHWLRNVYLFIVSFSISKFRKNSMVFLLILTSSGVCTTTHKVIFNSTHITSTFSNCNLENFYNSVSSSSRSNWFWLKIWHRTVQAYHDNKSGSSHSDFGADEVWLQAWMQIKCRQNKLPYTKMCGCFVHECTNTTDNYHFEIWILSK
jgi:hypothetical protein